MGGKRTGGHITVLKEGLLPLLPWLLAFCDGVVAKQCRVMPESSLRLPGWCVPDMASSTGELLNNVNRLRTGNTAQLPQGAIPLPPSYTVPTQKTEPAGGRARGAGVVEEFKVAEKGVRGLDKVRMEDVYEGSFNFAHPGYRWMDEVRASVALYGEVLGHKVPAEDLEKIADGGVDDVGLRPAAVGWGRAGHRTPLNAGKLHFVEQAAPPSEGLDWSLYSGIILCGLLFFGLLLYGFYVRFVRRTNSSGSLDMGQELESEDDELPPMEMRRSMANWRMLWRAILVSTESGSNEFAGGMSIEEIEKLPLLAHCEDCQCQASPKFRCIICLSDVNKGEMLREIPCCGHRFHANCVDPWLERSATCPLCRRDVVAKHDANDDGVQQDEHSENESTDGGLNLRSRDVQDVPAAPSSSSPSEDMPTDEQQDIATLPDPATLPSSQGRAEDDQDPPSSSEPFSQDDYTPGVDSTLPRSFGAASSDMDEWSEPDAPGNNAGVEVDGWELVDGGS